MLIKIIAEALHRSFLLYFWAPLRYHPSIRMLMVFWVAVIHRFDSFAIWTIMEKKRHLVTHKLDKSLHYLLMHMCSNVYDFCSSVLKRGMCETTRNCTVESMWLLWCIQHDKSFVIFSLHHRNKGIHGHCKQCRPRQQIRSKIDSFRNANFKPYDVTTHWNRLSETISMRVTS